jgi:PTH1 family peptidyl-tRNA hydrolase
MILFAGLGNPGAKYAGNRHNIGFMAVDAIIRRHGFSATRKRFQGDICEGVLDGERVLVLKPQTFMNESGRSVGETVAFYKLEPAQVVVFHDELDLEPGKVRVKTGGGLAGHNGLRSVAAHIGPDFRRVRLGIGHPGRELVLAHTLKDFSKVEHDWLDPLLDAIADFAPLLAAGRDQTFANKVHLALNPDKPDKDKTADEPADKDKDR